MPWVDADTIFRVLPWADAVRAVGSALKGGLDTAADPRRVGIPVGDGELLLMPSEIGERVGIKVASVSPGNPARGLPRIQAVYILMDAATLTPLAMLDGTVLTTVRTPAVSAYAVPKSPGGSGITAEKGSPGRFAEVGRQRRGVEHLLPRAAWAAFPSTCASASSRLRTKAVCTSLSALPS